MVGSEDMKTNFEIAKLFMTVILPSIVNRRLLHLSIIARTSFICIDTLISQMSDRLAFMFIPNTLNLPGPNLDYT